MSALLDPDLDFGEEPRIIHALPGRARLHAPGWSERTHRLLTPRLLQLAGVRRVQGNSLTGNVLVVFDPSMTNAKIILAALRALLRGVAATPGNTAGGTILRLAPPLSGGRSTSDRIAMRRTHGAMPRRIIMTDLDDTGRLSSAVVAPLTAKRGQVPGIIRLLGGVSGVLGVGICIANLLLSGNVFGLIVNGLELLRVGTEALIRRLGPRAPHEPVEYDGGYVIVARGVAWIVV